MCGKKAEEELKMGREWSLAGNAQYFCRVGTDYPSLPQFWTLTVRKGNARINPEHRHAET